MRALAWMAAFAFASSGVYSATTCNSSAATVTKYTALSSLAAARIEYADCSTKVVRVFTTSDGTTQLDLSNKQIVYVKSLPSVMHLNLKNNNISRLENVSIPTSTQTLDFSDNKFTSFQKFSFPNNVTKLIASNGKLMELYNFSFPDTIVTLNLISNPIAYIGGVVFPRSLKELSIFSTVTLAEFEVRQTDATRFASLQAFNVSRTNNLKCSDSEALYRYVQDTLLCVLSDNAFNKKYGSAENSSASGPVDFPASTSAPELMEADSPRRSKFLLFAGISLSLACIGLMSTLAPRTLYERYRKKILRSKIADHIKQQQQPLAIVKPALHSMNGDPSIAYWDL